MPDITFGASANAILHCGATPVFVDVCKDTWTIDPARLQDALSERTKAIMPVHLFGHPCDMDPIMAFARANRLKIVEDCAEALGAEYKGRKVGLFGDAGCFSFFANKVITTGEGGMLITRDSKVLEAAKLYRDHGMQADRRYWHLVPGYNYRMTNLQAALGLAQIEQLEKFLCHRKACVDHYSKRLSGIDGLELPACEAWATHANWLYVISIDEDRLGASKNGLADFLDEYGVETRNVFFPLHDQPAYPRSPGSFAISENIFKRGLCLPISGNLAIEDVERICDIIHKFVARYTGQHVHSDKVK